MSLLSLFKHDTEPQPPESATHVLHYTPAYLVKGSDEGFWGVQTKPEYEAGKAQDVPDMTMWASRDLDVAALASFADEVLGYPVCMDLRYATLYALTRPTGTMEPVYYLTPAA